MTKQTARCARIKISEFRVERTGEKVDWKSVTIKPGGLSAIMSMVNMLQIYSVYSWTLMVSTTHVKYFSKRLNACLE